MKNNPLFIRPQYTITQKEKEPILHKQLDALCSFHLDHCPPYSRIVQAFFSQPPYKALTDIPYIPVGLFKDYDLISIPQKELFKTLLSSGTTGSRPSKIFLDRETAHEQSQALTQIISSYLGKQRLPMLIVDSEHVITDPKKYTARGAGILGLLPFGKDHFYALNDDMSLKIKDLKKWSKQYTDTPVLIFGFTYIIWKYLLQVMKLEKINIPRGLLIHSGGWKKLESLSVNNQVFKNTIEKLLGIKWCYNFYGMVEQTGSIFMECEHGYLHSPNFADIIIRDPETWNEQKNGDQGIVQVLSILPKSYPGQSLLTEDLGCVHGIDNCKCGRLGKYFTIHGRVEKAEIRGCSDTYEP